MTSLPLPYLRVNQHGLSFFLSKATAAELRVRVDFHFREPYSDLAQYRKEYFDDLKAILERHGASVDEKPDGGGVQRALQKSRVYEIRDYVERESAILPSSVLLAIDTSKYDGEIEELGDRGIFQLKDDMHVSVIDGQHRLAGLFLASEETQRSMEIPIVFMLDIDMPTAVRLFQQINGKQRAVSNSVIVDLFDALPDDAITTEGDRLTKRYHTICKSLNADSFSPLFRQVKMLGIGGGSISQACFVETCRRELKFMASWNLQDCYDVLYEYFTLFQDLFPDDWPVPSNADACTYEELDAWSMHVLRERRSQLMKTNGFSAIIMLLEYLHSQGEPLNAVGALVGKVDWTEPFGTGVAAQKRLFTKLRNIIEESRGQRTLLDEGVSERNTISLLIDIVNPVFGTDMGNDDFVFGNYCEWPSLATLDDHVLQDAAAVMGLPVILGHFNRNEIIESLREAGMPEGVVREDAGEMRNYPVEYLYWRDE